MVNLVKGKVCRYFDDCRNLDHKQKWVDAGSMILYVTFRVAVLDSCSAAKWASGIDLQHRAHSITLSALISTNCGTHAAQQTMRLIACLFYSQPLICSAVSQSPDKNAVIDIGAYAFSLRHVQAPRGIGALV
jgi:hypothetical protein